MAGLVSLVASTGTGVARADGVVQVPVGGVPVPVLENGVVCGTMAPGWALEGDGRRVQPPRELQVGRSRQFAVRVAASAEQCGTSMDSITLIATSRFPAIDPASVTFFPGEGRLEFKGRDLQGAQIAWTRPGVAGQAARR